MLQFKLENGSCTSDFKTLAKERPDYLIEPGDDGFSWFELKTHETHDPQYALKHQEIKDFLKMYFECDVFEAEYVIDIDGEYDRSDCFFIVKNGQIERYVFYTYALGMKEVYDTLKGGAQ